MSRVKLPGMTNLLNVGEKYRVLKRIGAGAFGMVCEAINTETNERVAVKQVTNLFEDVNDAKRLLREISILKKLNHPSIVQVKELIVSGSQEQFDELYIVMEHAQSDLKKLIKSPLNLEESHIKTIAYNLLCAMNYVHSSDVLHRDLKPANILVNEDCEVKICDFGLARGLNSEPAPESPQTPSEEVKMEPPPEQPAAESPSTGPKRPPLKRTLQKAPSSTLQKEMTGHVVTRWYRAPELILMEREYTKAIDVWSVGCILAELCSMMSGNAATFMDREPLFPGSSCFPLSPDLKTKQRRAGFPSSSNDQLAVIFNTIGTPTEEDMSIITDERAILYLQSFGHVGRASLALKYPATSPDLIDILEQAIQFNPSKRPTITELLAHTWFEDVRDPSKETQAEIPPRFEFEDIEDITMDQVRDYFVQLIDVFNPQLS